MPQSLAKIILHIVFSTKNRANLIQYIDNQEEHHHQRSFQDELLELLKRYDLKYDEKYLWD